MSDIKLHPWLEKEMQEIHHEMRRNRKSLNKETDIYILKKFCLIGLPFILLYTFAYVNEIERCGFACVDLNHEVGEDLLFLMEWKCPQESCDYVNYEGIQFCAFCGTPHPMSSL